MESINFNSAEFSWIEEDEAFLDESYTESQLFKYDGYLLKRFNDRTSLKTMQAKVKVLSDLDFNRFLIAKNLPEIILPEFYFFVDEKFQGYGMKEINGMNLRKALKSGKYTFKQKLELLAKVGEFLEKMDRVRKDNPLLANFYLNDLHAGNVVVSNDSIHICDIDSCRFSDVIDKGRYPLRYYIDDTIAESGQNLGKYKYNSNGSLIPNRDTDIYMYLMMIYSFLFKGNASLLFLKQFRRKLDKMSKLGLPKELVDSFASLYEKGDNINPYKCLSSVERNAFRRI